MRRQNNINDLLKTLEQIQNGAKKVEFFLNCVQELKDKLDAYELPEDLDELDESEIQEL